MPEVLHSQYEHHGFFPDLVAGDMKYGYGKTRALVAEWDKCRGPDSKKSAPRNVFISFYRDQVQAAQEFNQTDTAKQGLKERMNIERLIYGLTNIYGARKAHSYGQKRTDFQLKMQATAFNLRQLVRQVLKKQSQGGVYPLTV